MELTIETVRNGYILRDEDGLVEVVANDNPVAATQEMLWRVGEQVGHIGSRYDEWRVRVVLERGDKWVGPEEAKTYLEQ